MEVEVNRFRDLKKPVILNILESLFDNFGLGFAALFFRSHDLALYKIISIWAISPLVSLPLVSLIHRWNTKTMMRIGILGYTVMALSLLFFNPFSFIIFGIGYGVALGCFWVSFNYVFFLASTNDNHAKNSSLYFFLGPLVGIIMPPLGALIIKNFGYHALFTLTIMLTFIPLFYIRDQHFNHKTHMSFSESNRKYSGLRLIDGLGAAVHFFQASFLTVYALLFLHTVFQVGGLLSYLSFASLTVAFVLAHMSDKFQKRTIILYPLLTVMAILILIMPHVTKTSQLVGLIGIYAIFDNLSMPIRFAAQMDVANLDIGYWRASEFWGNIGRTIVFTAAAILLFFHNVTAAFSLFGFIAFVLPFVMSWKIRSRRSSAVESPI